MNWSDGEKNSPSPESLRKTEHCRYSFWVCRSPRATWKTWMVGPSDDHVHWRTPRGWATRSQTPETSLFVHLPLCGACSGTTTLYSSLPPASLLRLEDEWGQLHDQSMVSKMWGVGKWGTLYPTSLFVNKDVRPRDRGQLLFRMPHSRRSAREDDADETLNNIGVYVAKFRMQNSKKFSTHVMIWIVYMTIQPQIVDVFSSLLFLIFSHSTSLVL